MTTATAEVLGGVGTGGIINNVVIFSSA